MRANPGQLEQGVRCACMLLVLLPAAAISASAQTIDVPRAAVEPHAAAQVAGQPAPPLPDQIKAFDTTHLADRPYTFDLPKPAFPAAPRVQRQFVVEYVYDYALTTYTPSVTVPTIAHASAKQDTPEATFTAFYSAMRQGDYQTWLTYWDEAGQKTLAKAAKDEHLDAAFWRKTWAAALPQSAPIQLLDRVETQIYVILDARLGGPKPFGFPTVLKFVNGKWVVTNELSDNPILYRLRPTLAGSLELVPPLPVAVLGPSGQQQSDAQQMFVDGHTVRSRVVETGR